MQFEDNIINIFQKRTFDQLAVLRTRTTYNVGVVSNRIDKKFNLSENKVASCVHINK